LWNNCRRLVQNDPSLSDVKILRMNNSEARRYGQALRHNSVVESLSISVVESLAISDGTELTLDSNGDLDPLLEFIARSQSLKKFVLRDVRDVRAVGHFFFAVSKSSSIKELCLSTLTIPQKSLKILLSHTTSLIKLRILWASIEMSTEEITAQDALTDQNSSIEELEINGVGAPLLIQVLEQFGSHSNIKRLSIDARWDCGKSVSLSRSVQQLLEASATLQTVEFAWWEFEASTFGPISSGLKNSKSLQNMVLSHCKLDSESEELLQSFSNFKSS
jgi:hypothetical protein